MEILKILFQGIKKTELKKEFLYIISISLVVAFFELLGLGAFSYLMTVIFSEGNSSNNIFSSITSLEKIEINKNQIVIIFVILFIVNIFFSFVGNYLIQKIIVKKYHHFRTFVFNEYIKKKMNEMTSVNLNQLINKINIDPGKFLNTGFGSLCLILKNLIIISIILSYLIYFNIYTIYILIFFICVFAIFLIPQINNIFKKISILERSYNIKSFMSPASIIQNFKEIKLFFAENFFAKKFYESSNKLYRTQLKLTIMRNIPKPFIELCLILIIGVFFINFSKTNSKDETFIFFSTLVFALIRLIPYVIQIVRSFTEILGAQEYFLNFLDSDYPKVRLNKKAVIDAITSNQNFGELKSELNFDIKNLRFKDVKFSFKDKIIFNELNLNINKGEKILIFGDSGEGKSVLFDLICGFREPSFGEILMNGEKINHKSLKLLQRKIGLISQNIPLINSSIIENVGFGKKISEIDVKKVKESLNLAGLEEFCNDQKLLNFIINSDFRNISEGQAKRLGLARLMYFDKKIILLDETTANLDKKLEKEILGDLLKKADLTFILVSHDPYLRDFFEKIYKLENKKLLEVKK